MTSLCAQQDSDQPVHLPWLIRILDVHTKHFGSFVCTTSNNTDNKVTRSKADL